jgi:hypothetical protein
MNSASVQPDLPPHIGKRPFALMRRIIIIIASICCIAIIILTLIGQQQTNVKRSVDGVKIRAIGHSIMAVEADFPGALSSVKSTDIYAFAEELARLGVVNDPKLWLSMCAPNDPFPIAPPNFILAADPSTNGTRTSNPDFRGLSLVIAVASFPPGTDITKLPVTTPIAWTRGLQSDGTWSKTLAPYGNWGGFIVFAGGNLAKYSKINGQLVKFGTTQPTSDIREALPPGTSILESPPKH